ncbi:MAG: anthranilate phosphoribosyltransferase [Deltaproteobacteria bacterium]
MIQQSIEKLSRQADLSASEMSSVMNQILTGACSTDQVAAFLAALADKGETVEEIVSAARVMRSHAVAIHCDSPVILDTCGTGGDKKNSFNVSTCASVVIAACGVTIAKHGNRSVSSKCGSADILESLGVTISLSKEKVERSLNEIGIAFLYAPDFHPAMKFAAPARKQLGRRTIFNILGPLCNPANATHQLIGVYSAELGPTISAVAGRLGTKRCLCVHGDGVMDEITTTGPTEINESRAGRMENYSISPADFGFPLVGYDDLLGGSPDDNAATMLRILKGEKGPKRDIVVFNCGGALYAADKAASIKEGIAMAVEAVDSGAALEKLEQLRTYSRS